MGIMKLSDVNDNRRYCDVYGKTEKDRDLIHKANKIKHRDPAIMSFKWIGVKSKEAGYDDTGWMFLGITLGMGILGLSIATIITACLLEPAAIVLGAILAVLVWPSVSAARESLFLNQTVGVNRVDFDISDILEEAYGNNDVKIEYDALINALDVYSKYADYGDKSHAKASDNVRTAIKDLKRRLSGAGNVNMTDDEALDMIRLENGEVT